MCEVCTDGGERSGIGLIYEYNDRGPEGGNAAGNVSPLPADRSSSVREHGLRRVLRLQPFYLYTMYTWFLPYTMYMYLRGLEYMVYTW